MLRGEFLIAIRIERLMIRIVHNTIPIERPTKAAMPTTKAVIAKMGLAVDRINRVATNTLAAQAGTFRLVVVLANVNNSSKGAMNLVEPTPINRHTEVVTKAVQILILDQITRIRIQFRGREVSKAINKPQLTDVRSCEPVRPLNQRATTVVVNRSKTEER